jgi:hypothetical protein
MRKRSTTMTLLTLELEPELYEHLREEASRLGKSLEKTAETILSQRLTTPTPLSEKDKAIAALRKAGLLTELGPEMKKRADQADLSLEEVRAALDATAGKPLSELIIEMRGPKI